MEVRFVSSLTSEDEERYAPALLAALTGLLGHTALAYTLHIRTSGDKAFHHTHTASRVGAGQEKETAGPPNNGNHSGSLAGVYPDSGVS